MVTPGPESWIVPLAGMALMAFLAGAVIWYYGQRARYAGGGSPEILRFLADARGQQEKLTAEAQSLREEVQELQALLAKV